jgi:hypothetical protein
MLPRPSTLAAGDHRRRNWPVNPAPRSLTAVRRGFLLAVEHPSPALLDPNWPHTELPHTTLKLPDLFLVAPDHRSTAPTVHLRHRPHCSRRYSPLRPDPERPQVRKNLVMLPRPSTLAVGDRRRRNWPVNPAPPSLTTARDLGLEDAKAQGAVCETCDSDE